MSIGFVFIGRRRTAGGKPAGWTALFGIACAALLLAALAGCGGGGGGGGGSSSTQTASVTGVVRDSADNDAGVGGATITIGGKTATTTTTAAATTDTPVGSFSLTGVKVGSTTATIVISNVSQTVAFTPSITTGANNLGSLFINIGQIGGRILLPGGAAASGAFVSLSSNGDTVVAASDGSFLLTNVPLGSAQLTAVLGTASLTTTVTVGNGVTTVGNLTLVNDTNPNPPAAPETISGTVLLGGTGGGAAAGTQVILFRNGLQLEQTITDASGGFSFYVPVGTYSLEIIRESFQTQTDTGITVVDPNAVLVVPNITLSPQ